MTIWYIFYCKTLLTCLLHTDLESLHVGHLAGDLDVVVRVGRLARGHGLAAHVGHGLLPHVEPDQLVLGVDLVRHAAEARLGGLPHPVHGEPCTWGHGSLLCPSLRVVCYKQTWDPAPVREVIRRSPGVAPLDVAVAELHNHPEACLLLPGVPQF